MNYNYKKEIIPYIIKNKSFFQKKPFIAAIKFQENILQKNNFVEQYINNPKYYGTIENFSKKFYKKNFICGDIAKVYILLNDKNFIIDIKYEFCGCGLNIAILEIICKYLHNKEFTEIKNINEDLILKYIQIPNSKKHCMDLALDLFKEV